jgi:hypothetical protein
MNKCDTMPRVELLRWCEAKFAVSCMCILSERVTGRSGYCHVWPKYKRSFVDVKVGRCNNTQSGLLYFSLPYMVNTTIPRTDCLITVSEIELVVTIDLK